MTAKHRKGKSNHKQEDNFFKSEILETEVRSGGTSHTPLLVAVLVAVIGCIVAAWIFLQQHLTLTDLTDSVMGIQVKIARLQSSHEELRLSNPKQHVSENVEKRLASLEESFGLAQKQVGIALATAEQLKTSDLPAQVLSLHTEMKTRLAEVQQATVSLEQLTQLQSLLIEKNVEFEDVRKQVEGLAALSSELSQKVEDLSVNLAEAQSKMEDKLGQVATMIATLDGQTSQVLDLKNQLDMYQAQLENNLQETSNLRELVENKESQLSLKASSEEQVVDQTQPHTEYLENIEGDADEAKGESDDEAVTDYKEELTIDDDDDDREEELATNGEVEEEAATTKGEVDDATTSEEEEKEAAEPEEQEEAAAEPEEQEEAAAEPEEQEEAAAEPEEKEEDDVTEAEDQEAAGAEKEESPSAHQPTEETEVEAPVAPEEERELSSKEESIATFQQQELVAADERDESPRQPEDKETEETATEKEGNEMEHEKLLAEKVQEDSPALEEIQEPAIKNEETEEEEESKMKDIMEKQQGVPAEEADKDELSE